MGLYAQMGPSTLRLQAVTCWMLFFCLCWRQGIQSTGTKPEWMLPQFPCDVYFPNSSYALFDCAGRNLKDVPRGIAENVTELDLSENEIGNVTKDSFSKLQNLTKLNLSWSNRNHILNIVASPFKNLTKLIELRLTGNRLTAVPKNLPQSIRRLWLNNNNVGVLLSLNFFKLSNVTHLWLNKNCYAWTHCSRSVEIPKDSFAHLTKLHSLDLSFNNLKHIPTRLPSSLISLMVHHNIIENIHENDFHGLPNLKSLHLQGNCQRCQNAPFPCTPCKNISLEIHDRAFQNLEQLQVLNLGGNSLTHIKPLWFENLTNLTDLYMSFNLLLKPIITKGLFFKNLRKLERIDLSFNFAHQDYPKMINLSDDFSNLVSLNTLHLEGLVFQTIGPDTLRPLYPLKNLSILNLGTNFIVKSNSSVFENMPQLKMINLAENRLSPIPTKNLNRRNNGYNQFPDHLSVSQPKRSYSDDYSYGWDFFKRMKKECLNYGKSLSLSANNIFFINPKLFQGYGNITCLNLSHNGFSAALNGTEFSTLHSLKYLDLSYNKIDLAYDFAFQELKNLEVLDLSFNSHYFKAFGVTHNLNFLKNLPTLRVLNMSDNSIAQLFTTYMESSSLVELRFKNNFLGTLWKSKPASRMLFSHLSSLTTLDISNNNISIIRADEINLPHNLTTLYISNNLLTDFTWQWLTKLKRLQTLDLSFNFLTNITGINGSFSLTTLDLSHNQISQLDGGSFSALKSLKVLSLSFNKLTTINQSTFQPQNTVETLHLQSNPFQCTCDLLDFFLWIQDSGMKIPRLTTDVKCAEPANQKGKAVINFDINECVNDSLAFFAYIFTSLFITIFMFVTVVSHLFYWDASYILHYMRAKLNGYSSLNSTDSAYDVFVTYDTKDPQVSEWVMTNLRAKLEGEEEGELYLPLCLEERDWVPGVPLVDNLTQSIRYSRKTLFVLTEGYVKTGVFKLAMYLAHQRLLDENVDVIVVLLLEPVLQHSHFLRLRRRLCGRSVLEWPRTAAAEPWFWQNLRNVVRVDNQMLYNKTYLKYFPNN